MKRFSLLLLVLCLFGSLALSGCSANFNEAGTPTADTQTPIGTIKGSAYGGQQPIAGAKIFLLKTGTNAYGGASTSILQNTGNTDTFGNYVLTDSGGNFNISGKYTCTAGKDVLYIYSIGGDAGGGVQVNSSNNPTAGLMAILGVCPSDGTFATHLKFVYVNEVSTVAAAFAFAPFAGQTTTQPERSVSIGPPSGSAAGANPSVQAFQAIATAANNAALLYNINGSPYHFGTAAPTTPAYAPFAIANATTPSSIAGNVGTVPQALLNTLANVLASCINSGAGITPTPGSGTVSSTACNSLFSATQQGSLVPDNTAAAALFIAQHPGAPASGNNPNYVQTIFNLAGTDPVFSPTLLTAPYDFTVAIQYTAPGMTSTNAVSIDGGNNAWITSPGNSTLTKITPDGVAFGRGQTNANYVAVDANITNPTAASNGNVWTTAPFSRVNGTTDYLIALVNGGNGVPDSAGNQLFTPRAGGGNNPLSNAQGIIQDASYSYIADFGNSRIVAASLNNPSNTAFTFSSGTMTYPWTSVAIDPFGNLFTAGVSGGTTKICATTTTADSTSAPTKLTDVCTPVSSTVVTAGQLATDGTGSAWITDTASGGAGLTRISPRLTTLSYTGGGVNQPLGVAVDGGGIVWVANTAGLRFGTSSTPGCTGCSISAYTTNSNSTLIQPVTPPLVGTSGTAYYSQSGGYVSGNQAAGSLGYKNLAIDGAGDIWITNSSVTSGPGVTEIIGVAQPTLTPLTLSVLKALIGNRP